MIIKYLFYSLERINKSELSYIYIIIILKIYKLYITDNIYSNKEENYILRLLRKLH